MLAKLSIVKFKDFGLNCFITLKDLMNSGREMEIAVKESLSEVIKQLNQSDPYVIPVSLLTGLCEMMEDSGSTEMLTDMFETCFPMWIK